jgi:hypothetical protein
MDASWYLFDAGSNALGGVGANVFRLMTVALAILLTIIYKRRTRQPFLINHRTIWGFYPVNANTSKTANHRQYVGVSKSTTSAIELPD